MTRRRPRDWCDPPEAFGQLTEVDNETPIPKREWLAQQATTPDEVVVFRAAVTQNAICLYVRQAKNKRPHPSPARAAAGHTFPLTALVAQDGRGLSTAAWQGKLTGKRPLQFEDLAVIMQVLPGALPTEREIETFLDVAEKRIPTPPNWGRQGWLWPDR